MKQTVETYRDGLLIDSREIDLPDPPPGVVNADAMRTGIDQALDSLRAYAAATAPTQAQTVAVVRVLCRVAVRLARLQLGKFDGTD